MTGCYVGSVAVHLLRECASIVDHLFDATWNFFHSIVAVILMGECCDVGIPIASVFGPIEDPTFMKPYFMHSVER